MHDTEDALCVALKPWAVNLCYLNKLITEEGEVRFELRKWNTTKSVITNGLSIELVKSANSTSPCTTFIYFKAPIALSDFVNNLKCLEIFHDYHFISMQITYNTISSVHPIKDK